MDHHLIQLFFLIFSGAAVVASIALFGRQPLLVRLYSARRSDGSPWTWLGHRCRPDRRDRQHWYYISTLPARSGYAASGAGPGSKAGYPPHPNQLSAICRRRLWGWLCFGFSPTENLIIGASMMFSSTIIGIKLLPTTVLHHKHSGELMVGMLLMQDFLAIFVLLMLISATSGDVSISRFAISLISLPLLIGGAVLMVRYILQPLFARFDRIGEYVFLLAIGWCLGVAELFEYAGLSREIGAFIAGISIATSPIAAYIALNLKPLRDFFLILFFFSLGGGFDLSLIPHIAIPAIVLGTLMLILKPVVYHALLRKQSESRTLAWDIGFRLGQNSEFSLLIAYVAFNSTLIGNNASHLIQAAAIITFLISSYIVVFNFSNPIAVNDKLRRD